MSIDHDAEGHAKPNEGKACPYAHDIHDNVWLHDVGMNIVVHGAHDSSELARVGW